MPKFFAVPVTAVNALQITMEIAMMLTRLRRSASRAIGMPKVE